jgi:GNAT superfamily N-acetyltransferase
MTASDLVFRPAEPADFPALRAMYGAAGRWLHDVKGITDQWDRDIPDEEVEQFIASGHAFVAELDREPAGALRLTEAAHIPWEVMDYDGLYLHGLVVRRDLAGRGLGRQMLAWAEEQARRRGKSTLRLDCMADNPRLCQYYADAGFTPLGRHPRYTWYALYEKKVCAV